MQSRSRNRIQPLFLKQARRAYDLRREQIAESEKVAVGAEYVKSDGATVDVNGCHGGTNQQWQF